MSLQCILMVFTLFLIVTMKRSLPQSRRYSTSKRVFCPHCNTQVQQRTYDEHRRNFYNEITKTWKAAEDNLINHSDSDSDVTSQCSEPTSEFSSPDDMYGGHESPTDVL